MSTPAIDIQRLLFVEDDEVIRTDVSIFLESIRVDLSRIPPQVATLVFTVNSFTGQDFSQIENAFCRIIDESTETESARYELTGSGTHNAQVMAKVTRDGAGWAMTAIGAAATGRTFVDLLPVIAPLL